MPISPHICLSRAWVPWRTPLVEVWKSSDRRTPSLARTPSEPRTQPASSSSLLAPAMSWVLHQSLAVEAKIAGAGSTLQVTWPAAP